MRDEELIVAIRNGDKLAKEVLARRYYAHLYAYYSSRIPREEAEDLTQLTLLHAVARFERFREESTFRHYAFAIARRIMSERQRKAERRLDTEEPGSEPPASQTTPSRQVLRAEFHERVLASLAELGEHYRVVVEHHLRGADNFEIAEALDLEYNTVRSRLSRGLALLKDLLSAWAAERVDPPEQVA